MDSNQNMVYQKKIPLIMREYGRNIQRMVDHCKSLSDRTSRQHCAETIISIMGNLFPERRTTPDGMRVLWNHLAIMSNFELDIDYPVEIFPKEDVRFSPNDLEYADKDILYRHYGHNIQLCINYAREMPEGSEKEAVVLQIANHMKTLYLTWNKDSVDDYRIFTDLFSLSEGTLILSEKEHKLYTPIAPHPKVTKGGKAKKHK